MQYRAEVDGLRAVAVVPVILFHAGSPTFGGGYVGVDVFLVISGYLITSIIVNEVEAHRFTLAGFYARRARRILPALFVVLICCIPFAWAWLLPTELAAFGASFAATALSVSNVFFWLNTGYFDPAAEEQPLLHTWSLGVEEQFYVLFPVLLVLAWGLGRRKVVWIISAGSVVSLILAQWASQAHPSANFYLLPTRAWELGIGALLGIQLRGKPPRRTAPNEVGAVVGLALIGYSVFAFHGGTPFPSVFALVPTVGTGLLILCAARGTTIGRILSSPLLVGIGLISYSAYLWHLPLLVFAERYSVEPQPHFVMLALAPASLILAYLSWRFVEQPFRNRRDLPQKTLLAASAAGIAVLALVGLTASLAHGFPSRLNPPARLLLANSESATEARSRGCVDRHPDAGLCTFGTAGAPASILLWGDSHAWTLMPAVDVGLVESGKAGLLAARDGCAPLLGVRRTSGGWPSCVEFNEAVAEWLEAGGHSIRTVILAARWALNAEGQRAAGEAGSTFSLVPIENGIPADPRDASPTVAMFEVGLDATVSRLRGQGFRVVILGNVPEIGWNVPQRLLQQAWRGIPLPPVPTLHDAQVRESLSAEILADVAVRRGARVVPLTNLLCTPACRVVDRGRPVYSDDDHLSSHGARHMLGPMLAAQLR